MTSRTTICDIPQNTIGWREWIALPQFGIVRIKAKVDTGARTSALDARDCKTFRRGDETWVRFCVHYGSVKKPRNKTCEARLLAQRKVTDSGGHSQSRYVIRTPMILGSRKSEIEITLTRRDDMKFRMLIGRSALKESFIVDAGLSYLNGKPDLTLS